MLVAQAIGRWGNWFNQELFGRPTDLPWGLEIDPTPPAARATSASTRLSTRRSSTSACGTCVAFGVVIWVDRRFRLGHGRVFALYVMAYTLGRGWIETLRIDDVELDDVVGLRLNVWTSIVLFVAGGGVLRRARPPACGPGREERGRTRRAPPRERARRAADRAEPAD